MKDFNAYAGGARHVSTGGTLKIPSNAERLWTFAPDSPLTVRLPDARRLQLGWGQLTLINTSDTFPLTIHNHDGVLLGTLAVGLATTFGLYDKSTAAGSWLGKPYATNIGTGTPPDYILQIGGHANNGDVGDTSKWTDIQLFDIPTGVWLFFNAAFPVDMRNAAAARIGTTSYIKSAGTGFFSYTPGSVLALSPTGTNPTWNAVTDYLGAEAQGGSVRLRASDTFSDFVRSYEPIGNVWTSDPTTTIGTEGGWRDYSAAVGAPFNGTSGGALAAFWAMPGPVGDGFFVMYHTAAQTVLLNGGAFNWDRPSLFRVGDNHISMAGGSFKSSGSQESNADTPMLTLHNQYIISLELWWTRTQTPVAWKGMGAERSTAPSLSSQAYTGLGSYYSTAVNGAPTRHVWRWNQLTDTWDLNSEAGQSGTFRQLNAWTTLDRI